jgi:hypothetical protein
MGLIVNHQSVYNTNDVGIYNDDGTVQRFCYDEGAHLTEEVPFEGSVDFNVFFDITKSNSDEGLVSGWANVAVNADGSLPLDWQDDIIRPEVLEKAAINFMKDYRTSGVMHEGDAKGVVVESIVFTKEKQKCIGIPEGSVPEGWFITVKIFDSDVFKKVKDGTLKMFSIQGRAKRVKL